MDKGYKTVDLYYAAFLKASKVNLLGTEGQSTGKVIFVFEDINKEVIQDLKRKYFNRDAIVNARDYAEEIRNLKIMVHS